MTSSPAPHEEVDGANVYIDFDEVNVSSLDLPSISRHALFVCF